MKRSNNGRVTEPGGMPFAASTVERGAGVAVWRQIEQTLASEIAASGFGEDGRLPSDEDEPGSNVYFRAGTSGGRFRMDFTTSIDIAQVNTYSWHPNSRGPQLYKLYAADGSDQKFNPDPKRGVDPASCGWKLIALVSTLPEKGDDGGQYAASVSNVGKYRYLLFDCYVTELYDNWGNTFYSEIDVIRK